MVANPQPQEMESRSFVPDRIWSFFSLIAASRANPGKELARRSDAADLLAPHPDNGLRRAPFRP
jgi:hypothetical protein